MDTAPNVFVFGVDWWPGHRNRPLVLAEPNRVSGAPVAGARCGPVFRDDDWKWARARRRLALYGTVYAGSLFVAYSDRGIDFGTRLCHSRSSKPAEGRMIGRLVFNHGCTLREPYEPVS